MKQRGFTLVELAIVIAIMAILLTLAVVNVRSTQLQARDNDRHVDVENIAKVMEAVRDNVQATADVSYPSALLVDYWLSTYTTQNALTDRLGPETLRAPGVSSEDPSSLTAATNNVQTAAGVRPEPTVTRYVYQPLDKNNTLCSSTSSGCVKFNIYYRLESPTDNCPAPDNICIIRSKRQ